MNEATFERLLDAAVRARLATDRAYRYAEDADAQRLREAEIEDEEADRIMAEDAAAAPQDGGSDDD